MKNLLVRIKFNWSWVGGLVLIVMTGHLPIQCQNSSLCYFNIVSFFMYFRHP